MKKYCLLLCCLFTIGLFAQPSIDNFTRLESSGDIPIDFKQFVKSKINDASDFYIKEQFGSGNILYGSKLNDYVNIVADNLLKEYPDLKEKLRFYIVRSTDVNAYCTEKGIMFINIGLIAQLSNESELAYIMAHEIAHFAEHHILDLNDYKDKNKSNDYKEFYLKYHNRSRENELEADRLALERYYKSSPYSYSVLDGVFDVLQYDYLPFDEVVFPEILLRPISISFRIITS
jgi:predicted Zn-dependent protease